MPTKTWKATERKVAEIMGGERVGNRGKNTEDVSHNIFSVEVKHGKSIPKLVTTAMNQCRTNAPKGKIPLVVLHAERSQHYMAVLDLPTLMELVGEDKAGEILAAITE